MIYVLRGPVGKSRFLDFLSWLLKHHLNRTVVFTTCIDGTQQIHCSGALCHPLLAISSDPVFCPAALSSGPLPSVGG